jgi:hypothetical protein
MCEDCKEKGPKESKCWPNDSDYLDGATELFLPSERYLKAYWDADILDDDKNPKTPSSKATKPSKSASASSSGGGCGSASAATGASTSASRPSATEKTSTCPMSCRML